MKKNFNKEVTKKDPEKKIKVSEGLYNCYINFNVSSQIENMKILSKKDLYLLLCLCLDRHDYTKDNVVKLNLLEFKKELKDIHLILDGKETEIKELLELVLETGDSSISIRNLVAIDEKELPPPKEKLEVRNQRLDELIK